MPIRRINIEEMEKIGVGLDRPEDVVVGKDGHVWASDHYSACAEIMPDGTLRRVGKAGGAPNGINMDAEGSIIIANFGIFDQEPGPLQRLDVDTGEVEVICAEVEGRRLTSCNYPVIDSQGTIWCTHSTFAEMWPRALDGRADGFVFKVTSKGHVTKVADELKFANGCCLDAEEKYLYVNQTSGGNVVRFEILPDGTLGSPEQYGPMLGIIPTAPPDRSSPPTAEEMATWAFTDGNGFDREGNLWVTLPAANKIVAITPDLEVQIVAHDPSGEVLNHPTNVTWGGDDMCDLYIGSIQANYIVKTRSPIPGMPMVHQK
jgi:gluconolactonase